jgi:hypothetical protein
VSLISVIARLYPISVSVNNIPAFADWDLLLPNAVPWTRIEWTDDTSSIIFILFVAKPPFRDEGFDISP